MVSAGAHTFGARLRALPTGPGVYLMRAADSEVLYVGKAANLRSRVSSYFGGNPAGLPPKIRRMVRRVADFEFIVTESEQEALILESNLIKERQPQYNARLKDDKSYPFIKIDVSEDFPLVYLTRRVKDDGARYFGPFASAYSVRKTLAVLKKLFPYRSCTKTITGKDDRACLDYFIHRCAAPCIGAVDREGYHEIIDQVAMFLEGRVEQVVRGIRARMEDASDNLEFERAAVLRDQLADIEKMHEGQKVLHLSNENADVIALAQKGRDAWVEVFFIRQGKLVGRENFLMHRADGDDEAEVMAAFVKQFYSANPYAPRRILLQHLPDDLDAIQVWLRSKRAGAVELRVPKRGEKRKLVEMVAQNAAQGLEQLTIRRIHESTNNAQAIEELQEALNLPAPPNRIECYDISNTQGSNPVGSMVVFENGRPNTSLYRRFKIKTVAGVDDYSMMREMLSRRFKRLSESRRRGAGLAEEEETAAATAKGGGENGAGGESGGRQKNRRGGESGAASWGAPPDLVIIDGGKGHLGAALQVFLELGINDIPLSSLAKQNEEIFVPYEKDPIILPKDSQGLFLFQRARDEAHRFAITFHRERRSKKSVKSTLDLVPGIGPKRKRMLIRRFGSVKGVREATLEEVAAVPGMTMTAARAVKDHV